MKHAPPIIGPLEFEGLENRVILIEHDDDDCIFKLLREAIHDKDNIIFSPEDLNLFGYRLSAYIKVNSIYKVNKIIKKIIPQISFHIINRIDMMDLDLGKRERGAQVAAYLSMIGSPKNLRGANLLISSSKEEHSIREKVDKFINLRK